MVDTLWTAKDVARITRKTEGSIFQAVKDGLFDGTGIVIHLGRLVRFHPDRLMVWLEAGGAQWPGGWRKAKPEEPEAARPAARA